MSLATLLARLVPAATFALVAGTSTPMATPETVVITLRPRFGADSALLDVLDRHWATVRAADLTVPATHLTLRGSDADGRVYFVEVLTWRDASIPDSAPPAVRALWGRMNELTEARGQRPGLEIIELSDAHPPSGVPRRGAGDVGQLSHERGVDALVMNRN